MSTPDDAPSVLEDFSAEEARELLINLSDEDPEVFRSDILPTLLQQLGDSLEPMAPQAGISRFLTFKGDDVKEGTLAQYRVKMDYAETYLIEEQGLSNLNDLTPRVASDYREWRRTESLAREEPLKPKTLKDDMHLYRDFLNYMATLRAVSPDVPRAVIIPILEDGDGVDRTTLAPDRARKTLEYLGRFEYASLDHINFLLFSKTGRRPCDLRALDLHDFDDQSEETTLEFVHRPESGTPLKEGEAHEASITVGSEMGETIRAYIDHTRSEVTDQAGREPLLATSNGRVSKSTLQEHSYKWTRPCMIGTSCPHDKSPANCEAAQSAKHASKCPSSRSPRPIRSGYITAKMNAGARYEAVGHRVGATEAVLRKHYDTPEKDDERRRYREEIMNSNSDGSGYNN